MDGIYIQWSEILRDRLNRKLKNIQRKSNKDEHESESEEEEIEEAESYFGNHDTSEKNAMIRLD